MNIPVFELERVQSMHENTVEYNLTESGFHPYTLDELLDTRQIQKLNNIALGYGQTNGSAKLRKRISSLYKNADVDEENILVTNGSSEANFVACHTLLEHGDEVVMMVPNYMQIWGIAKEMGCTPKAFHLREENNWKPDIGQLESLVNPKTKMIAVCNPNNPTGYTLSKTEMQQIVEIAKRAGAWVYSDEVYRGAELDGRMIESFAGTYDKVIVNGGLSKAYALPGLRLGWLTGPKEIIDDCWAYHDYTSITTGILSRKIGTLVLRPEKRRQIINRNRAILNKNLKAVKQWLNKFEGTFKYTDPQGGGMIFIKYNLDINSTELSDWLREEKSVFILAGDTYGMDYHFRIGIGARKEYLLNGLKRVENALRERFDI
ncbi:MAG TPA: aminotransferase class I/II-fold pyridoxal phosphate-dependent enzyme [Balneolaceae bacterium]|nr:aminotransferase class I/II-fold pyridoxal phosphate-dependent enzyme [Balneolaceae bacterium]